MNRKQFVHLLENLNNLNFESIALNEKIIAEFPYCQIAEILYVLNLYKETSIHYTNQLRIAAAYAPDRSILKILVDSISFKKRDSEKIIEKEVPKTEEQTDEIQPKSSYNIEDVFDKAPSLKEEDDDDEFNNDELSYAKDEKLSKEQLIDKFIKEEPRISPPKREFYNPIQYARKSLIDDESLVSETLAEIYLKQGNISKAVKIFEKLILNYSKKSTYFAGQIEKIKEEHKNLKQNQ
ncbi:MAG: hypothetical protein JEY97_08950 [Bacteroidales bacterium]|nr:hypothetical protein [Bacteroidales bacterium]